MVNPSQQNTMQLLSVLMKQIYNNKIFLGLILEWNKNHTHTYSISSFGFKQLITWILPKATYPELASHSGPRAQ